MIFFRLDRYFRSLERYRLPVKIYLLLLKILTWLYWLGYQLRKGLYGSAIIRPVKTGIPVISVGNLTWGGTGKTPLVIYLASRLEKMGKKVVVLTRGYGRKSKTQVVLEKKGLIEQKWRDCGDEPFLICQSLQNTAVVTNSKRVKSAEWAKKNLQPDVFILDDGFQHWKLHRDLDLVLVDSASPFGNGKLIPSGILREPLQAIKRGDVIAITKVMDANKAQTVGATIENFTDSPLVYTRYKLSSITELENRRKTALDSLMDKEIFAFCGIGNPESFYQILEQNRLRIVRKASFPDHYGYETLDLFTLEKEALKAGADYLATTTKDALKIPPNLQLKMAVLIFEIAMEIISGEELLWQKIDLILKK